MISWSVRQAARAIQSGEVIAYPTETVYGLGCDPLCGHAVARILAIKQRPLNKGLILLAGSAKQLSPFIELTPDVLQALTSEKASPTTWVVPARASTPPWLTGQRTTVAVRLSTHATVTALCQLTGRPIVSTSANFYRQRPIRNRYVLQARFGPLISVIVPGQIQYDARPSRIIDLESGKIIRTH